MSSSASTTVARVMDLRSEAQNIRKAYDRLRHAVRTRSGRATSSELQVAAQAANAQIALLHEAEISALDTFLALGAEQGTSPEEFNELHELRNHPHQGVSRDVAYARVFGAEEA